MMSIYDETIVHIQELVTVFPLLQLLYLLRDNRNVHSLTGRKQLKFLYGLIHNLITPFKLPVVISNILKSIYKNICYYLKVQIPQFYFYYSMISCHVWSCENPTSTLKTSPCCTVWSWLMALWTIKSFILSVHFQSTPVPVRPVSHLACEDMCESLLLKQRQMVRDIVQMSWWFSLVCLGASKELQSQEYIL